MHIAPALDPAAQTVARLSDELKHVHDRHLAGLNSRTRLVLLVAALDHSGEVNTLEAAACLWLGPQTPALSDEPLASLLDVVHGAFRFAVSDVRSAVIATSTRAERRDAHASLAKILNAHPARCAWHRAEAVDGPDEAIAQVLADAGLVQWNSGDARSAQSLLVRASQLSTDAGARALRLARAARVTAERGDCGSASEMLRQASECDGAITGSLPYTLTLAQLLLEGEGDAATAHRILCDAIDSCDSSAATEFVDALHVRDTIGSLLVTRSASPSIGTTVNAAPAVVVANLTRRSSPYDVARAGAALAATDALGSTAFWTTQTLSAGTSLGYTRAHLEVLRQSSVHMFRSGRWTEALAQTEQGLEAVKRGDFGAHAWWFHQIRALIAAARGDALTCEYDAAAMRKWGFVHGADAVVTAAYHPWALLTLATSTPTESLRVGVLASPLGAGGELTHGGTYSAFDTVDAAFRAGEIETAQHYADALDRHAEVARSPRLTLRRNLAHALVAPPPRAEDLYLAALNQPAATEWPFEYARARLAYGEWLRRNRSSIRAREHLIAARRGFGHLAAQPWHDRCVSELRATGLGVTRWTSTAPPGLTAQESEIAELAALGLTNKQIAARLVISPRTVGAHLYRIFPKLGICSRAALRDALSNHIELAS